MEKFENGVGDATNVLTDYFSEKTSEAPLPTKQLQKFIEVNNSEFSTKFHRCSVSIQFNFPQKNLHIYFVEYSEKLRFRTSSKFLFLTVYRHVNYRLKFDRKERIKH